MAGNYPPRGWVFCEGQLLPINRSEVLFIIAGRPDYLGLYCQKLAAAEGRNDVTALPYGLSTPVMFVYLFAIIGPVYFATRDALLAYRIGLAAAFIGGRI